MGSGSLYAAAAAAFWILPSACTEHAYEHDVRGRIVDEHDRPVVGASVTRVRDAGGEQFGLRELYRRTTGVDGTFAFTHEGLGGKPPPTAIWHLRVEAPRCEATSATITVPLDKGVYAARDVVLRLRCPAEP